MFNIISIHASREGGDALKRRYPDTWDLFQSTPPVREATKPEGWRASSDTDFNPRLP